jgi:hypothetical protein
MHFDSDDRSSSAWAPYGATEILDGDRQINPGHSARLDIIDHQLVSSLTQHRYTY